MTYEPDEFPSMASQLFLNMIRDFPDRCRKDWPNLSEAAGAFLSGLDAAEEESHVLAGAIDIVGHLRNYHDPAAQQMRTWITKKVFLSTTREMPHLHAACLYALAAMQRPDRTPDLDFLRTWLCPREDAPPKMKYRFIVPAFTGIAFSNASVPVVELLDLLAAARKAEDAGMPSSLAPAILALFVERDPLAVRAELWDAVQTHSDTKALWDRLGRAVNHSQFRLPTYQEMVQRTTIQRKQSSVDMWNTEMRCTAPCAA
jgi:hypothetical protein